MITKKKDTNQLGFYNSFEEQLNHKHPLYVLAQTINWQTFEDEFRDLYSDKASRLAKRIRLMVSLIIIKHVRNISDESVIEQWQENAYYQYFSGETCFASGHPCEPSDLVHFRNRIGEEGILLIFQESIRVNGQDAESEHISIDTTVQEKNITFPTDDKLYKKIIEQCQSTAQKEKIKPRQSYTRTLKKLNLEQRFRNHPKNKVKARKADKKVKTIAGRLVREMERKLPAEHSFRSKLKLFQQVLDQNKNDKNKIYSLHEPEVCCISKGKAHKKYEFGNKVSLAVTQETNVIVGALSFRNPFDGHTFEQAVEQVHKLTGKYPKTASVDRGYRGVSPVGSTVPILPSPEKDKKTFDLSASKKAFTLSQTSCDRTDYWTFKN